MIYLPLSFGPLNLMYEFLVASSICLLFCSFALASVYLSLVTPDKPGLSAHIFRLL